MTDTPELANVLRVMSAARQAAEEGLGWTEREW